MCSVYVELGSKFVFEKNVFELKINYKLKNLNNQTQTHTSKTNQNLFNVKIEIIDCFPKKIK
jgi:hypothetical protein